MDGNMLSGLVALFLVGGAVAFVVAGIGLAVAGVTCAFLSILEHLTGRFRSRRVALTASAELDCELQGAWMTIGEDGGVEVTLRFRSESEGAGGAFAAIADLVRSGRATA